MKSHLVSILSKINAEYAEIRYEEVTSTQVHFVGKELESIGTSVERGGNIRVKGKAGWSFFSFNQIENLPTYLSEAIKYSRFAKNGPIKLAPVPPRVEVVREITGKDPRKVDLEEKYNLCSRYNHILLSGSEIQTSDLRYADIHTIKYYANTEGTYIEQEWFYVVLGMTSIARRGGNIQSAHEGVGGVGGYEIVENLEEKAERATRRALELLDAEPLSGGRYTVIVDPKLSGVFAHEAFGHLSEADFLYENERLLQIMKSKGFQPKKLI